jgi:hypothetical protein
LKRSEKQALLANGRRFGSDKMLTPFLEEALA